MNQFKCISSRGLQYQLKRLQCSSSNSTIQIPSRIERGSTDILNALESTIPNDPISTSYIYHDDPFLLPIKKQDFRSYALSYESGKKTAMWIHKEHGDLFPRYLSEPQIKAFQPPMVYTHKEQVSEKTLVQAISEYKLSDAIHIYELLETNVSIATKQALLELLCFYNNGKIISKEFPYEQWFSKPNKLIWCQHKHIEQLYEFLTKQDPETAALAHNAMLCGLAKYMRIDEAWQLYKQCEKENIPLSVTSYNYTIMMLSTTFSVDDKKKENIIYDILKSMNKNGVKPNVRTLNAALKATNKLPLHVAEVVIKHLCKEFEKLNIKFSLATYYYIISILSKKGSNSYNDFMNILHKISKENFTMQDPADVTFFTHAMYLAAHVYNDRKAGDMIHKILLTDDNYKFISNNLLENAYYNSYISLLLMTSTIPEFFEFYQKFVPNIYIPSNPPLKKIIHQLKFYEGKDVSKYILRVWSDLTTFGYLDIPMKLSLIKLMEVNSLSADSSVRSAFADAAWSCWNDIKTEIQNKPETYTPVETAMTGSIAVMLLDNNRIDECIEILTYTIEQSYLFIPTMTQKQLNKLFESCVSQQCIIGAFLVLEYTTNFGFPQVTEMAMKLYNLPQLTKVERNKLINLVGEEALNTLDVSKSS